VSLNNREFLIWKERWRGGGERGVGGSAGRHFKGKVKV